MTIVDNDRDRRLDPDSSAEQSKGVYARGLAICSLIDCCIACRAIKHRALLIRDDRDFDVIGRHFPLQYKRRRFERAA